VLLCAPALVEVLLFAKGTSLTESIVSVVVLATGTGSVSCDCRASPALAKVLLFVNGRICRISRLTGYRHWRRKLRLPGLTCSGKGAAVCKWKNQLYQPFDWLQALAA
jgi:hypothetical protein